MHIKLSGLEAIFERMGLGREKAFEVLKQAHTSKLQLRDRYFVAAKGYKSRKKLERTVAAENDITERFNAIHAGLVQIKQGKNTPKIFKDSKAYLTLKEVAQAAEQYAKDFNFQPVEDGYKSFIELGMQIMGRKYTLGKLKFYLTKIYEITECLLIVQSDINPEGSKEFYRLWKETARLYSTANIDLIAPEDFVHIVLARDEADSMRAKYRDWITAQFEGLAFMNAIPELHQFYGMGAQRRYNKYAADKGFRKLEAGSLQLEQREYKSEQDQQYWDLVRKAKESRVEV